tara:strand:- start:116 stop:2041 length:1926 start_codon:yes stop_codon:yes gene_type:complete
MSIKSNAVVIRDETTNGANTAIRVGGTLVQIADDLISKQSEIDLNSAKVGITPTQAAQIIANQSNSGDGGSGLTAQQIIDMDANTEKVGITSEQASQIIANSSSSGSGVTSEQASDIIANNAKVGYSDALVSANSDVASNTAKVGYTEVLVSANTEVAANTLKVGYTEELVSANSSVVNNNSKVGITSEQASDIQVNNAKVGLTTNQANTLSVIDGNAVAINTLKVGVKTNINALGILSFSTISSIPLTYVQVYAIITADTINGLFYNNGTNWIFLYPFVHRNYRLFIPNDDGTISLDTERFFFDSNGIVSRKYTDNLFILEKGDRDKGYNTDGTLTASYQSSGFIRCEGGATFSSNIGSNQPIVFFDANKVRVGSTIATTFTIPNGLNIKYFNLTISKTINYDGLVVKNGFPDAPEYEDTFLDRIKSRVRRNLNITVISDSIGSETEGFATKVSFMSLLNKHAKYRTFNNVSSSGRGFFNYADNINIGGAMPTNSDLYVFTLGANDFGFNRGMGQITYDTSNTFLGSIRACINNILALNSSAKFAFITPIQRTDKATNVQGRTIEDFVEAVKYFALHNNYEVFDAYNHTGIDFGNTDSFNEHSASNSFNGTVVPDGLHPTNDAHYYLMQYQMAEFFLSLI